jgi:hypothetical protein
MTRKGSRLNKHMRHYEIAGITVQVESDLPITDATFHKKFASFRVDGPGTDTVVIRHHFRLPDPIPWMDGSQKPEEVYRKAPWAIFRTGDSWVYLGIAPDADDPTLHQVAVFNADHSGGDIYSVEAQERLWSRGGVASLTMFPTDQILLARLVADREGCFLHSGALTIDGRGFVFVGHSEAGKSTTMELVRQKLGDRAEILCDDRNIVRRWVGGFRGGAPGFYVHGTWSHGDVPDVSPASAPLRAVLFLEQSEQNEVVSLSDRKDVWRRLLATLIKPLVTVDWWRKEMDVVERIVSEVPCFAMRFDKSGAIVDDLERLVR